jgi:hypothetical protein
MDHGAHSDPIRTHVRGRDQETLRADPALIIRRRQVRLLRKSKAELERRRRRIPDQGIQRVHSDPIHTKVRPHDVVGDLKSEVGTQVIVGGTAITMPQLREASQFNSVVGVVGVAAGAAAAAAAPKAVADETESGRDLKIKILEYKAIKS